MSISPAERELLCQRCTQEYVVWFCPNEIWNQVQREGEHFFCPTCFTVLAEQRGIKPTGWLVRPETEADGDVSRITRENARLTTLCDGLRKALRGVRAICYDRYEIRWNALAEFRLYERGDNGVYGILGKYDSLDDAFEAYLAANNDIDGGSDGKKMD